MIELIKRYRLALAIGGLCIIGVVVPKFKQDHQIVLVESTAKHIEETVEIAPLEEEVAVVSEMTPISLPPETVEPVVEVVASPIDIPVYICGQVQRPGVYYVAETSIIFDVLTLGGGFTDQANQDVINLADKVAAHQKIYIPQEGEEIDKISNSYDNINIIDVTTTPTENTSALEQEEASGLININTASKETLMNLPGIGDVKASQIITYRTDVHLFQNIEEITAVSGIGDKTFEKIKQLITV